MLRYGLFLLPEFCDGLSDLLILAAQVGVLPSERTTAAEWMVGRGLCSILHKSVDEGRVGRR